MGKFEFMGASREGAPQTDHGCVHELIKLQNDGKVIISVSNDQEYPTKIIPGEKKIPSPPILKIKRCHSERNKNVRKDKSHPRLYTNGVFLHKHLAVGGEKSMA